MDIFNVGKENYKEVMRWVASKKTNDIEDLVTAYMNEMIDKFPVILEEENEKEVEIKDEEVEVKPEEEVIE